MSEISRRDFLRATGLTVVSGLGFLLESCSKATSEDLEKLGLKGKHRVIDLKTNKYIEPSGGIGAHREVVKTQVIFEKRQDGSKTNQETELISLTILPQNINSSVNESISYSTISFNLPEEISSSSYKLADDAQGIINFQSNQGGGRFIRLDLASKDVGKLLVSDVK